ncbi:hypothetical protein LRH25_06370 [Ideonella azotifigens]|nr:hypothetical protein [Ideonella azotifigens]MCD2339963.1 hypothetical protein [Ideonella azotifigens]
MNIWISAIAAVAVQPLVFLLRVLPDYLSSPQPLYEVGLMVVAVVAVGAAVVLVLGIPAFLALRRFRREGWGSLGAAGALLGALPRASSWPRTLEGYSAGQNWHGNYIETYVNGTPTTYAWLTYAESVLLFALHGLVGALVFYGVWRSRQRPNQSFQPTAFGGD